MPCLGDHPSQKRADNGDAGPRTKSLPEMFGLRKAEAETERMFDATLGSLDKVRDWLKRTVPHTGHTLVRDQVKKRVGRLVDASKSFFRGQGAHELDVPQLRAP